MTTVIPSELEDCIQREQEKLVCKNNKAGRETLIVDLKKIRDSVIRSYQAGQKLIEEIKKQDPGVLSECMRLHNRRASMPMKLAYVRILRKRVVVPRYIMWFEEVQRSRPLPPHEVLCSR